MENSRMAKLAVNELTTYRWSFEEDVHRYAEAQVPAIGIWRQKLSDFGEERGVELIAESGLAVSSLSWAGGFTGSEGRSHQESVADACQAIHLAAQLKAPCLVLHSGARGVHTQNHARRLLRMALEKLLPQAEEHGVALAIEPMCRAAGSEWTFLHTLEETRTLIKEFSSAALKLVLDTYHWGHQADLLSEIPHLAAHLALVQLSDARQLPSMEPNRTPLGCGVLPLAAFVGQLMRAGYDGFFEVELMGEEIERADYQELIAQSRSSFDSWTTPAEV